MVLNRLKIGHKTLTHGNLLTRKEFTARLTCIIRLTIKHVPLTECHQYEIEKQNQQTIS